MTPLLFSRNCFPFEAQDVPLGHYNPRVDAIFLWPDGVEKDLFEGVVAHEGKGHRAFALQASSLRVQRIITGHLYSHLATILRLLASTGLHLAGRTIDDLCLEGTLDPNSRFPLDHRFSDPHQALSFHISEIKRLDTQITSINEAIRPVYEIIGTAWAAQELYRRHSHDYAMQLEEHIVDSQAETLEANGFLNADQFRHLYSNYSAIESSEIRFIVGLSALDVGTWIGIDGLDIGPALYDRLARFSGLIDSVGSNPAITANPAEYSKLLRTTEVEQVAQWIQQYAHSNYPSGVGFGSLGYQYLRPWRLMLTLDLLLFSPYSRMHEHHDGWDECMDVTNKSLFRHVISNQNNEIDLDLTTTLYAPMATKDYMRPYCDWEFDRKLGYSPEEGNPVSLDPWWYKEILLYESLYQALFEGEVIHCPASYEASAECNSPCPILLYLLGLEERIDLPVGLLCNHMFAGDHHRIWPFDQSSLTAKEAIVARNP